jgi:hypothetical protein
LLSVNAPALSLIPPPGYSHNLSPIHQNLTSKNLLYVLTAFPSVPRAILVRGTLKLTENTFFFTLISDDVREKMKNRYLSNPDYNFEKVNRASMACGPMVKWAIAQVIQVFK